MKGTGGEFEGKRPYECALATSIEREADQGSQGGAEDTQSDQADKDKDNDAQVPDSGKKGGPLPPQAKEKTKEEKYSKSAQAYHVYLFEAVAMNKAEMVAKLLEGGVPCTVLDGCECKIYTDLSGSLGVDCLALSSNSFSAPYYTL